MQLSRFPQKRIWAPLAVSLLLGLFIHSTMYMNGLVNPDGLWNGEYSLAGQWEASLGRWGLYFVDILHGGLNSTTLAAFFTILYIALAGTLLVPLFRVTNLAKAILIPTVLTCSPMVSMFITYPYCGDAYALSMLLAVLAVYAMDAMSRTGIRIAVSALCVTFLISLYQSSLGVFLATAAGYILIRMLRNEDTWKQIGKNALHLLAATLIGMALYYGILQLMLRVWGVSLGDYRGAASVTIGNLLRSLPDGIRRAYSYYKAFLFDNWLARNAYLAPYAYGLLAGMALLSLIVRFAALAKQRPYLPFVCVLLLGMFPICCNMINLIVPNTDFYLLMVGGMMMTMPLLIAITESGGEKESRWLARAASKGTVVMAAALVWIYVLSCQTDASVMQLNKNQTVALANRIWQQAETSEAYAPDDTKILIAGHPQEGNYPNTSGLFDKANVYAQWGTVWKSYHGNIQGWQQVYRQYLGVSYESCTAEQYAAISATKEFRAMPLYPQEGSVQVFDDVLVVKVSDTAEWEN